MPSALLQPCSGLVARRHYEETIQDPVDIGSIQNFLTGGDFNALLEVSPSGKTLFWGVTPGERGQHITKWERVRPGDVVFFAQDKALFSYAYVTYAFRNAPLAKHLWGTTFTRNGLEQTWELMFAMSDIYEVHIPYGELNRLVGRKPGAVVQEFNVVPNENSEPLLEALNLLDNPYIAALSEQEVFGEISTPEFVAMERKVVTMQRAEQQFLRRSLFRGREQANCDLCGRLFGVRYLTASHIKKRALCTDDEKRDYENIVMANCRFGCDELYGAGLVAVSDSGVIIGSSLLTESDTATQYAAEYLLGKKVARWDEFPRTREYFLAHARLEFRP